ncbi:hypothetical protein [Mucilaginibacter polytrichastri]|uniref:Uncharacterized protein n=1 Tax=Mucilaginibacter polytrichastri TaxID=1302689 RepID=A0A1Q5ZZU7_9SPHI|nr:hypothetical protein [Mucilaginibacter polytrichastri]OKS87278.1 hypothetical protein RG47T_2737 [Mucilaginibacter polytrichastri]SFT18571.1 hypothetical protein SAMN04487890_11523 [Mucilaginibacter polytrichastri]
MKNLYLFLVLLFTTSQMIAQDYTDSITFQRNYHVGDYVEFVGVHPPDAVASGYYEISISYTRGNIAAGSTHLASITHADPALWREVGKINGNPYILAGLYNFTVDFNTEFANPRFRIRATNTYGDTTRALTVHIKVHSIGINSSWTPLRVSGNDVSTLGFLPMTDEWSLYVGNDIRTPGAKLAIRAIENGYVGINSSIPDAQLTVGGLIHATGIKMDLSVPTPDYVFDKDYDLTTLKDVKAYIDKNHHLPEIPSAAQVAKDGINLGEMNAKLLKKIEELTLYLIEKDNELKLQKKLLIDQQNQLNNVKKKLHI